MRKPISKTSPYLISALLGAVGGGILVMVATRAQPSVISNILSGMMQKVMSHMRECGCKPEEMCKQMIARFAETSQE